MDDVQDQVFDLNAVPQQERAREIGPSPDADLHVDPLDPPGLSLEAPVRHWRVARALERMRAQINAAFPQRSKDSDGTIGDAAHASRASDHNAWIVDDGIGVVSAF